MPINTEKKLNQNQLEAVNHDTGPALVVAGAGTGKTTVLIERLNNLFKTGKARADEILILTFTEKGAGELEDRALKILPLGFVDLWINTFHGFTERILREHALDIGLSTGFKLLAQAEQWILIKKNLDKFKLDYYAPLGSPNKFIFEIVKHFSRLKDENISSREYLEYAERLEPDVIARSKATRQSRGASADGGIASQARNDNFDEIKRINELANAYHVYNQLLLDNEYLDFGDLIMYAIKLFRERPNILHYYQQKFKFIMVDEFQDTNMAQYELIKILAGQRADLMAVGDDNQAIYKFRGASLSNIMQYKSDYPSSKEIVLNDNYRSRQEILDLAYRSIRNNDPDTLEAKLGISKKLRANTDVAGESVCNWFLDSTAESEWIAGRIKEIYQKEKEVKWSDFAILVRANAEADNFVSELARAQIPNTFVSLKGLYYKPDIMDILAFFRLLDNYHEASALFRVLNMDSFLINHADIIQIANFARRKTWSLYEALENIMSVPKIQEISRRNAGKLAGLIKRFSEIAKTASAGQVFVRFVYDSGILSGKDFDRDREFFSLLNQFYRKIKDFESREVGARLKDFLEYFDLELEAGETGALRLDYGDEDTVKIMTVHSAKGLEFATVFVPGLVDKRFPSIGRKEKIPVPDSLVKEKLPAGKEQHLAEERRLFYVAVTRAKRNLYLSGSADCGGKREKKPSLFLSELDLVLEKRGASVKSAFTHGLSAALQELESPLGRRIEKYAPPEKFSFSQIEAFSSCPLQYKFNFILKLPVAPKAAFVFGRVMHNALKDFFTPLLSNAVQGGLFDSMRAAPKMELKTLLKIYEENWQNDGYETKEQREKYRQEGHEIMKKMFFYYEKAGWPAVAFLEKNFLAKFGAYAFKGAIDRVDKLLDGTFEVIDYKTGNPKEKLVFDNKRQLILYKIALEEGMGVRVSKQSFHYLASGEKISFCSTAKEEEKFRGQLLESVAGIVKGDFPPQPSMLCDYCDFNRICEHRQ